MSIEPGVLYVVATPVGNLADLSGRARDTLAGVDIVAAEDTRHTGRLLRHLGIEAQLLSLHEHNEAQRTPGLLDRLRRGEAVALVSDAGTPLVSDPGYRLVRAAAEAGMTVSPVPGPSAVLAALSVSGLATDRFVFEGFLPARGGQRRVRLDGLADEPRTLVLFESPRRLAGLLQDAAERLGGERAAVVARELTKIHETVYRGSLDELARRFAGGEMIRGEIVVCIEGRSSGSPAADRIEASVDGLLRALLAELPLKRAVAVAAELAGGERNRLYQRALELRGD